MVLKTKEQMAQLQKEKLKKHVEAINNDIKGLSEEINHIDVHKQEIKDIAPEVFNILMGIQRDLRFGKDRLKEISKTLFKGR